VTKIEKFCVMVLDDDMCQTTVLTKALRTALSGVEVLTARSVAEAQLLLSEFKIHCFILDVNLPDGTGIDFLCDVRSMFPDARALIISSACEPEIKIISKELGAVFLSKPVDKAEVVKLVREHYENSGHATSVRRSDGQFAVSVLSHSALEIIQLKCVSGATIMLQIESPKGSGRIHFDKGQIIHAETLAATGERAFEEILCWNGGRIKEMAATDKPSHTITMDWQGLLLNICQRIDEKSPGMAPSRIPAPC
jgi:response regulator RpfG family c-di-GMP phosphodiesterase